LDFVGLGIVVSSTYEEATIKTKEEISQFITYYIWHLKLRIKPTKSL